MQEEVDNDNTNNQNDFLVKKEMDQSKVEHAQMGANKIYGWKRKIEVAQLCC
jgi:hypothetical protein